MRSYQQAEMDLKRDLERLETEVKTVYSELVLPTWETQLHGLPQALYGYMMGVFARIDLYSSYWSGTTNSNGQTKRMVEFMNLYMSPNREANSVAVHLWRHKLMHTSRPRQLAAKATGTRYYWLLHWWDHLPREQHYTFSDSGGQRKLNIGLVYLIEDLQRAVHSFLSEVSSSIGLQENLRRAQEELTCYTVQLNG